MLPGVALLLSTHTASKLPPTHCAQHWQLPKQMPKQHNLFPWAPSRQHRLHARAGRRTGGHRPHPKLN